MSTRPWMASAFGNEVQAVPQRSVCARRPNRAPSGRGSGMPTGGFTLVEILVALAVFAVVGLMSAQLMSRTLTNHEVLSERSARLADVQRAMLVLKRDLVQISDRPVRDLFGDPLEPVMIGADGMMEFSRTGWRNPLNSRRSELQRVAYRLHDGDLLRAWWNVLDRAQNSEPAVQRLLSDVDQVEFFALDAGGDEHGFWPRKQAKDDQIDVPLVAIIMRIEFEPFGIVERIWPVAGTPGTPLPMLGGRSTSEEEDEEEGEEDGEGELEPEVEDEGDAQGKEEGGNGSV